MVDLSVFRNAGMARTARLASLLNAAAPTPEQVAMREAREREATACMLRACTPYPRNRAGCGEEIVYHGTSAAYDESIRAHGLRPSTEACDLHPDIQPSDPSRGHIGPFATRHPLIALYWAIFAECRRREEHGAPPAGSRLLKQGDCAIHAVRVPRSLPVVTAYLGGVEELWLPGGVGPDRIEGVRIVRTAEMLDRARAAGLPGSGVEMIVAAAYQASRHKLVTGEAATLEKGVAMRRHLPRLTRFMVARGELTHPPWNSLVHGEMHSRAVALAGLHLAQRIPGADVDFVVAFAILHDMWRADDGEDPEHGERAADRLLSLCQDPGLDAFGFPADTERTRDLAYALANHPHGDRADGHPNVNVGICWDADRLNLWRVRIQPDAAYLTTKAARSAEAVEYGRELCAAQLAGRLPSWREITQPATKIKV